MDKRELLNRVDFGQRIAEEESDELSGYFVETDHWRRLYAGDVDIVYGPKGSGKSALYALLLAKTDSLIDRNIILSSAENPRGASAFRNLVIDPPASEREFVGLWKLFFSSILAGTFDEYGIENESAAQLRTRLEQEGLIGKKQTLQSKLKSVVDYVKHFLRKPQALEAGIEIDPYTQLPKGIKGKIIFQEPSAIQIKEGIASVDNLLELAHAALADAKFTVWILIDRLDNSFQDTPELEQNALRALFRVYLDITNLTNIRLKVFLRTDIWNRITRSGFREASHITRHVTVEWNKNSLLNLTTIRRALHNNALVEHYALDKKEILHSQEAQEKFFYRIFPSQVDVGPNKPTTFDWMLGRTRDGTGKNAPRELIHLLNKAREVQSRKLDIGESMPDGEQLFLRSALKDALPEVSQIRLTQTLYAEYPLYRDYLEKLRGAKTQHNYETLRTIWNVELKTAVKLAQELSEIGFFEMKGTSLEPVFWVPFLYRDALELVQGAADN